MGTDLHAPLGTQKTPPSRRRFPFGPFAALALVLLAGGLSTWSMLTPDGLTDPEMTGKVATTAEPVAEKADALPGKTAEKAPSDVSSQRIDGANIETTQMDDGSVVTKITPRKRDKDGPVIVNANNADDPHMAAMPRDELVEDSVHGKLPIVGPDGNRPFDAYSRPWSGARGTRIAIVVGGLGLSQTGTQRALKQLPEEVTLAFAASGNSLMRWMQQARKGGHEVLLQLPFEPFDYPANDPGRLTLLTKASAEENLGHLHEALASITNYTGVMNYQGGRFLTNPDALEPVMRDLAGRGLMFLDDGSNGQSLTGTLAKVLSMPHAFADVELDGQLDRSSILAKLDELERIALRKGQAIGVASGFDETIAAIAEWAPEASRRGIEIVGVSNLAEIPR